MPWITTKNLGEVVYNKTLVVPKIVSKDEKCYVCGEGFKTNLTSKAIRNYSPHTEFGLAGCSGENENKDYVDHPIHTTHSQTDVLVALCKKNSISAKNLSIFPNRLSIDLKTMNLWFGDVIGQSRYDSINKMAEKHYIFQ